MNGNEHLTFAILDRQHGIPELPPASEEEFPLPAWYRAVRETPLNELGIEDICKACRQQIYPEHIIPIALRILKREPMAGEMYEGELFTSLISIPNDFWCKHQNEVTELQALIKDLPRFENISEDVRQDMEELLVKMTNSKM